MQALISSWLGKTNLCLISLSLLQICKLASSLKLSKGAYDVGTDHERVHGGYLAAYCWRHIFVFNLQRLQELIANFSVFGNFKLDLTLQGAVASWLHVMFSTELLFLFAQTVPLLIHLEMLVVAFEHLITLMPRWLLFVTCCSKCALFIAHDT